jgi:hypothetical protein
MPKVQSSPTRKLRRGVATATLSAIFAATAVIAVSHAPSAVAQEQCQPGQAKPNGTAYKYTERDELGGFVSYMERDFQNSQWSGCLTPSKEGKDKIIQGRYSRAHRNASWSSTHGIGGDYLYFYKVEGENAYFLGDEVQWTKG